jgi:hypothetical protein
VHRVRKEQLMKPAIKKALSGKTMRVATVFTGAAACAAAFTPAAAVAATAQPGHQLRLDRTTLAARPDKTSGSIREATCSLGRHTWVHFQDVVGTSDCWGFRGTWSVSRDEYFVADKMCGGNNVGSYGGYPAAGRQNFYTAEFGPGSTYVSLPNALPTHVTFVRIFGWSSGQVACPTVV